jgi:hypothetical protein
MSSSTWLGTEHIPAINSVTLSVTPNLMTLPPPFPSLNVLHSQNAKRTQAIFSDAANDFIDDNQNAFVLTFLPKLLANLVHVAMLSVLL